MKSVVHGAHRPPLDKIADRIEEEIARLRKKRPHLDVVIDRAAGILATHLSCPKQRVIVVRIGLGGRPKFLVNSLSESGATYVINPVVWSCTCPAAHCRPGRPCKHVLSAYILWQAGQREVKRTCDGCHERFPRRALIEVLDEHLCRSCADAASVL